MIKTVVEIEGMSCGMCEAHVNDAVRRAFAVKKVSSSHKKGITEILSEQPLEEEKLRAVISATGYQVISVSNEPKDKAGFCLFRK